MISVVMPLYRANPVYLQESVNSITEQTYRNWELILVMDPFSVEEDNKITTILSRLMSKHKNIRLIMNTKKLGIANSINNGILSAKGEVIARMDSDDISEPRRLKTQLSFLKAKDLDFVGSWATLVDQNRNKIGELRTPVNHAEINKRMIFHNPFIHPTMMFLRKALLQAGLYDPRLRDSQDYELYMRLVKKGFVGMNVPQALLNLRENMASATRGHRWYLKRIDELFAKTLGFTIYGFHSIGNFLLLVATYPAIFLPPKMVPFIKKLAGLLH